MSEPQGTNKEDAGLFELCKEVYKRTGWKYEVDWMLKVNVGLPSEHTRRVFYEEDNDEDDFLFELEEYGADHAVPLYTSDYILERLSGIRVDVWSDGHIVVKKQLHDGVPEKVERKYGDTVKVESDTLLNALLKLVIELHESGELNHG